MTEHHVISGVAAPIPQPNLDTDQIMPKQFLRGIDKKGLDKGLLYDMRFDRQGQRIDHFVLNRNEYANANILVGGANFGCGSSREHAVWGLNQFGIQAVIASSFAEIFYSNAMNNRLLLVVLTEDEVKNILADVENPQTAHVAIDLVNMTVQSHTARAGFKLHERHRRMFLENLDLVDATLTLKPQIDDFVQQYHKRYPWQANVASKTVARLRD